MPKIPTMLELLQAGVHFGHKSSRWHPKMKPYLFGERNGIHVIDLEQTLIKLEQALDYVRETVARGGTILFLGTKRQAKEIVRKAAEDCKMPYVVERWLGGTMTNFSEVYRLVKRYNELLDKKQSGELEKYTKKEQSRFGKEMEDLETKVGGIRHMIRQPDAMFIIDIRDEKTALAEAAVKGIPVVALTDSNVNPEKVHRPIPSNDDAVKAIELMTRLVSEAVNEGLELRQQRQTEAQAAKPAGKPPVRRMASKPAAKPAPAKEAAAPAAPAAETAAK
jgi:small subunit ribosomal protein S2